MGAVSRGWPLIRIGGFPAMRALAQRLISDPARAGALWAEVDQRILQTGPAWIPITNPLAIGFVSRRVGNHQFSAAPGDSPLIDQMWIR